jgi:HEAT repeat protein
MTPEALVQGLEDLHRGYEAQLRLVVLGESAVAPLARFLLGPPGLHAQPRMLAAEALGLIGGARAVEALATALVAGDLATLDPVVRLSEEAVREAMARELGRLGGPAAVEPLLEALQRFHLVEAGLALARVRERRAVPLLVDCLEDPFRRERAGAALREFGAAGVDALIESLQQPRALDGEEVRPSLERRAESARLLGELGDPRAAPALREGLTDAARDVRVAAAVALARLGAGRATITLVPPLLEGARSESASVADECAAALVAIGPEAAPAAAAALSDEADRAGARREAAPTPVLRRLARVLGALGDAGTAALVALSHDARPLVRGLAVANLGRAPATILDTVLGDATHDPDSRVRRTAEGVRRVTGGRTAPAPPPWSRTVRRGWDAVLKRLGHG